MYRLCSLRFLALTVLALMLVGQGATAAEPTADEKQVAADYVRAVQDARAKLHEAGFTLGKVIGPLVQANKDIDLAEAEAKYGDLRNTIGDIKKSVAAKKVPEGESGAAIDKAWKAFAKVQTRVVEFEMAAIIVVLDDESLDNAVKKAQILKLIDRIVAKEKKDSEALTAAQAALQTAFGLGTEEPK
ncbi:MAG: hypothetical protein IAF94_26810 [Pirellulaceae bacterium]|nr:hypothetical protein [Pirellulaceae bacterium]